MEAIRLFSFLGLKKQNVQFKMHEFKFTEN